MNSYELYAEDLLEQLKLNNTKLDILELVIKELLEKYEKPRSDIEVKGEVEVTNQPTSIEMSNADMLLSAIKELKDDTTRAIKENSHKPLESVKVANAKDLQPKEIVVKNLKNLDQRFKNLEDLIMEIKPIVEVHKEEMVLPTSPRNPLPVRLSDGKQFYNAQFNAVTTASQEVDPLVGYYPSDKDVSSDPKYWGFMRKKGEWYIMEENVANGTYRYAWGKPLKNGGGLYTDAWTDRANLTYEYFSEVI